MQVVDGAFFPGVHRLRETVLAGVPGCRASPEPPCFTWPAAAPGDGTAHACSVNPSQYNARLLAGP